MKNVLKILGMVLLVFFTAISFASCSDDDDPANNDFFAGTYTGQLNYTDGSSAPIDVSNGKVFVTKIASGTKYNFTFSNDIPALTGVEFEKQGDNILVMVGSTATSYIRIDNDELKIFYARDGKIWTANATR